MRANHLDDSALLRYAVSDADVKERARVKRHVAACRRCNGNLKSLRQLDKGLRSLGPLLAFDPGDPFAQRPEPRERMLSEFGFGRQEVSAATVEAVSVAATRKEMLLEASRQGEEATRAAISGLLLDELPDRFGLAHALEESLQRVATAPREGLMLAGETLRRLAAEPHIAYAQASASQMTLVEYAAPLTDLVGLAHLLAGAAYAWMAEFHKAEESLTAAYRRLAEGKGSEHHFAWVELYVSQCRSFAGRPQQGLALVERALGTFEAYGLDLDVARARNVKAIALYYRCRFENALRELRRAQPVFEKHESWNEFVSTMDSIGFALMELERRKEAIKEYAKAVECTTRVDALSARSQLQIGIGSVFHNEGRWKKTSGASRPVFHLPALGGSTYGREHADRFLAAAAEEGGLEKATALIHQVEKDPSRGYAYLFFSQLAISSVPKDPARYVALARRIAEASRSLPYRDHRGPAQPVCRESVLAEAALLESHSLNTQGKNADARQAIQKARENFAPAGDDSLSTALCNFYEGSAASFDGDYRGAWKLLRSALSAFHFYGQQNWIGRAEGSLGNVLMNKGSYESAVFYFDSALGSLHPQVDRTACTQTLMNRAYSLVQVNRLSAAKVSYAKALRVAREDRLTVPLSCMRYGLATIELKRGQIHRALRLFEGIASDARRDDLVDRIVTAELRIAECLGRLGRDAEMHARVDSLRRDFAAPSTSENPGLLELFKALDKGEVTAGLVAHVAAYVEDVDHGSSVTYQPFRLIAGGRSR